MNIKKGIEIGGLIQIGATDERPLNLHSMGPVDDFEVFQNVSHDYVIYNHNTGRYIVLAPAREGMSKEKIEEGLKQNISWYFAESK